jgi:hypothetical protein
MQIQEAVRFIVGEEKMRSRKDLDIWCGSTRRHKLYEYVKRFAPEDWGRFQAPKSEVRRTYEELLTGYKDYKPRV